MLGGLVNAITRGRLSAIAAWVCLLALVTTAVFASGFIRVSQTFRGPFAAEPAPSQMLSVTLSGDAPSVWFDDWGNDVGHKDRTDPRVTLNGVEWPPAETPHADIRLGKKRAYSHWARSIFFSLPPGTPNDSRQSLVVSSRLVLRTPFAILGVGLSIVFLLFAWVLSRGALESPWSPWGGLAKMARRTPKGIIGLALGWVGAWLVMIALSLNFGIYSQSEKLHGPFVREGGNSALLIAPVGGSRPPPVFMDNRGDAVGHVGRSDLVISVNGKPWPRGQSSHEYIRAGEPMAYAHWERSVYFALPNGMANNASTTLDLHYKLTLKWWAFWSLLAAGLSGVALGVKLTTGSAWMTYMPAPNALRFCAQSASWALALSAILYFGSIATSTAIGAPLPTAAICAWAPRICSALADGMAQSPAWLIAIALLGSALSWLLPAPERTRWRGLESWLIRHWGVWLAPVLIAACVFAASAGGWSGRFALYDMDYMSIGGLVPHSDAGGYWRTTETLALTGHWGDFGSRRPVAAAYRQALALLSGYNYPLSILVQDVSIALALSFATRAVFRWAGVWSAMAFAAAIFGVARPFLNTTMTEPISLILALCAVPFVVRSLEARRLTDIVVATGMIFLAMQARMGALFWLPALVAWGLWAAPRPKWRSAAVIGACLVGVIAMAGVFASYQSAGSATGGNLGYTLCGLARGTSWGECRDAFHAKIVDSHLDEKGTNAFLVQQAIAAFKARPDLLIGAVIDNAVTFLTNFPAFLLVGYIRTNEIDTWPALALCVLLIPGLYYAFRRRDGVWLGFWVLLIATTTASAALILRDDGFRALHVTHVFLILLLCLGFTGPHVVRAGAVSRTWADRYGGVALLSGLSLIAVLAAPTALLTAHFDSPPPAARAAQSDWTTISGGRRITGFVVFSPGDAVPRNVAAMPLADFRRIGAKMHFKEEWGLDAGALVAKTPIAFISVANLSSPSESNAIYLAPADLLSKRDVRFWLIRSEPPAGVNSTGAAVLRRVLTAVPRNE